MTSISDAFKIEHGTWSRQKVSVEFIAFGKNISVKYNDWALEWRFPLNAVRKEVGLKLGFLTPHPWEISLGFTSDLSVSQVEILKNI